MRMSTLTGFEPPTRSITRSWMARSSLACRRESISLISSSSRVPPLASSNLPMRRATAPVKAPFSWPNSSDSSRFSGIAAQLTEMNGWLARAALAVDVARHHLLAGAGLAGDQDAGIGRARPGRRGAACWRSPGRCETIGWLSSATAASTAAISSASGGSGMYSLAPARMARTAAAVSVPTPQATTGTWMRSAFEGVDQAADVELDVDHHQVGALAGAQARRGRRRCRRPARPWRRASSRSSPPR